MNVSLRMFIMQVLASQLYFLSNENAEFAFRNAYVFRFNESAVVNVD